MIRLCLLALLALPACRAVERHSEARIDIDSRLSEIRLLRIDSLRTTAVAFERIVTETLDTAGRPTRRTVRTVYTVKDSAAVAVAEAVETEERRVEHSEEKKTEEKTPDRSGAKLFLAGAALLVVAAWWWRKVK